VDRITMASSVEGRNPYLDRDLVEYATTIPFEDLFDGRLGKVSVRRALRDLLPNEILQRAKMGFGASLEGRSKPLVDALHKEVVNESGFLSEYFVPAYLKWICSDAAKRTYDGVHASWNVFMFALWRRVLTALMQSKSKSIGGRANLSCSGTVDGRCGHG
jgi:asparagine synthase (glutamine-hydrolysing)